MTEGKLQWHPAFVAALHIEFADELDLLEIKAEHLLGKKPMQIDVLVIKKAEEVLIRKNIGRIFRKYNIIEYKSPEDSLSINDFYKTYAYTCFYQSDTRRVNEISPKELTITFVCNHYPVKMLCHLTAERKLSVVKKADGIYYLTGDEFPIQLLITKQLSKEENYWLQSLRSDLKAGAEIRSLIENYEDEKSSPYHQALMDLIVRANAKKMKEERTMCQALKELFADELKAIVAEDVRKETAKISAQYEKEWKAQARKRGLEQGRKLGLERGLEQGRKLGLEQGLEQGERRTKQIFKLSAAGLPIEAIAEKCGVSVKKVQQILE